MKIFLSHSSTDKSIVRPIYNALGAALCIYDEASFDPAGSIPEEIYKALNECTHFVLFASPAALESRWVKSELSRSFENWMTGTQRRALVFLLDGASFSDVPPWLQVYIMREPPTHRHILCRIQSEIDKEKRSTFDPPFYHSDELQKIESKIIKETHEMPGAIFVHGPDGYGRKSIINELYRRQFKSVSERKLLIHAPAFSSEIELHREVLGLLMIGTPSEFLNKFKEFEILSNEERTKHLSNLIEECTSGNQCLIIEGENSLQAEDGKIPEWLINLIESLSGKDYPKLAIIAPRKATQLPASSIGKIVTQEIHPLNREKSNLLFEWWLKKLELKYEKSLKEIVLDACSGNPKQIELGARLLIQEGQGNIKKLNLT